ncbi:MAG TPA: RNA ligase (ATP) [Rubricoccaceae bacterium]|jgi:RNA ligase (TIGR02306 family)
MERQLATVQRILQVDPIPGADAIEVATVRGWKVVTKKGEYRPGDLAVYCEIDSFLPIHEAYEFLRRSSYRRLPDGTEGFRLRTVKLRGQVSQGLLLPTDVVPSGLQAEAHEGLDVTDALGVVKYEPPVPPELAGMARGPLPFFLQRTDEERVQNLPELFGAERPAGPLYATEKLDGSSATFYLHGGEFGVCSRNLDLLESSSNTFWRVARALGVETKLRAHAAATGQELALQGELVGAGVPKNPYGLNGQTVHVFTAYDTGARERLPLGEMLGVAEVMGLPVVPVVDQTFSLPSTMEAVLALAEGPSALNPGVRREGIVVRSHDGALSFKVISNAFLLAEK